MATPTCGCCNQPSTTGDPCEACRNHDYDAEEDPPVEHDYTPEAPSAKTGFLKTGDWHTLFGSNRLRFTAEGAEPRMSEDLTFFSWPAKGMRWIGRDDTECEMMRIRKDYHAC